VSDALERRIRLSGLKLPSTGAHALRHSFAVHLLRQGVDTKTIGDTLGHRDIRSTYVYLRLGLEDLRECAMPMPILLAPHSVAESAPAIYRRCHRAAPSQRTLPKRFHSMLGDSMQHFVRLKRTLGRRYRMEAAMLARWDDFLHRRYPKARHVTGMMFSAWTPELSHLTPTVQSAYQRVVRSFLLFHAREHTGTFIPDALSMPKSTPPPLPRLVSQAEMAHILDVARRIPPSANNPLRSETFRLGLILLFCCGLRRNELLRLTLDHVDLKQSLIRIENTKFHKSRLVPLAPTVVNEVARYLRQRQRMKACTAPTAFLLASRVLGDKAYADHTLLTVWHQLCLTTHLLDGHGRPPRLHDLRHSFAVNTLQRWYVQGTNVQSKLPHLATYLGHASAASTHYYLKLTPELRQEASQRFHQRFAPLFTKGGLA
jgi:integrase/recombinase XerD